MDEPLLMSLTALDPRFNFLLGDTRCRYCLDRRDSRDRVHIFPEVMVSQFQFHDFSSEVANFPGKNF